MILFALLFGTSISMASAAGLPALAKAEALDFRIEVGRERYLLRISRESMERLSDAVALGQPISATDAMVVREDQNPVSVSRRVPQELARRATALWRMVKDHGWAREAGIEWDPALGMSPAPSSRAAEASSEGLRDALSDPGSRAGVWVTPTSGALRDQARFGVRCVEPLSGPSRCFRVWPASNAKPAGKTT